MLFPFSYILIRLSQSARVVFTDSAGTGLVQMSVVIWLVSFLYPLQISKAVLNSLTTGTVLMVSSAVTVAAPEFYWYKKSEDANLEGMQR